MLFSLIYFFNVLESWTYDGGKINLVKVSDIGDTSNYLENGEWQLLELRVKRNIKLYSCCTVPYPE